MSLSTASETGPLPRQIGQTTRDRHDFPLRFRYVSVVISSPEVENETDLFDLPPPIQPNRTCPLGLQFVTMPVCDVVFAPRSDPKTIHSVG